MRKLTALLLVLILLICSLPATAENPEISGVWYTDLSGIPAEMNLSEDGTYSISIPGYAPDTGVWELRDEYVYMDGSALPEFTVMGDKLLWSNAFTFFTREKNETYVPAEVMTGTPEDLFGGYWRSVYVDIGGTAYPASAINDKTDLYVEGTHAILGGPIFCDAQVKMESTDGALTCLEEGASVQLQLQQDGYMRMTLAMEDGDLVWYLLPAYSQQQDPDAA